MPSASFWRSNSVALASAGPQFARLGGTLIVVAAGWGIGRGAAPGQIIGSNLYDVAIVSLLAVGLYSSTYGIDLPSLLQDRWLVARAATIGVLVKTALIAVVMVFSWREPKYLVLAVAVAQVDPLSISAIGARPAMTRRARTVLAGWASFDDPVTALLTVYLAALVLPSAVGGAVDSGGSLRGVGIGLGVTAVLASLAWLLHLGSRNAARSGADRGPIAAVQGIAIAGSLVLAVAEFLMLFAALLGLILRPAWLGPALRRITTAAYFGAALALGLVLTPSVKDLLIGVTLGITTVLAHAVTALLLTRGLPRRDRAYLALGQQNGITAITLALLLEPAFPGTVAIVAVAVLVVNLLYVINNAVFEGLRPAEQASWCSVPAVHVG